MPAVTTARTSELYYRAHKYLAFIGIAIFTVVALLAHRFIELWLGPGFSATARALIVLTGVQIANLAGGPALLILVGGNSRACRSVRSDWHVRNADRQ